MLYAVKGNKQLKIDEADKDAYLKLGYDIAEEKGGQLDVVTASPSKTVSYAKYQEAVARASAAEAKAAELAELAEKGKYAAELEKQNAALEKKVAELEKKTKEGGK